MWLTFDTQDACGRRASYETRANRRSIDRATPILNGPDSNSQRGRSYGWASSTPPASTLPGRMMTRSTALLVAICLCACAASASAQDNLKRLSIEELMRIDVTTTARQLQPLGTTAAAIFVITGDDIRRAGVTTIADALLLADGMHVARFNNGTWAISARGFNTNTANKLLVMIDGRTVYSPLFAGVFWNMEDYVLGDIDRIEVVRGPGATLWGANAVNGVVNIITRHARDTQGTYVSASTGPEDPAILEA